MGFTDSIYFRDIGARAYGLIPFEITADELGTMHGHRERVSTDNIREGLRILYSTVVDVSALPGHPVAPQPLTAQDPSARLSPLVDQLNAWDPMQGEPLEPE